MTREEAIEVIKQTKGAMVYTEKEKEALETLIPEFAESEDEKIIRLLRELGSLDVAKELYEEFNLSYTDVLYWFEKQKEQKPVEWSDEDVEHVNSVIKKLEGICRNQFVSTRFAYSEDIDWLKSLPLNLKKKNEDVPKLCSNEWSEEDETEIKRTIGLIEGWMNTFKETYYATDCKKSISWLKSLRPQPKQEWSEEDELKRDNLVGLVEEIKRQPLKRLEDWDGYINWLKSLPKRFVLQPKKEWNNNDEHILNNIYDFVAENTIDINRAPCAKECLDWLKSFRSQQQPSWKPTEEQIKAIRLARSFVVDDFSENPTLSETLKELEEQLKKL